MKKLKKLKPYSNTPKYGKVYTEEQKTINQLIDVVKDLTIIVKEQGEEIQRLKPKYRL